MTQSEIWKQVKGYLYEVSNLGNVRSLKSGQLLKPDFSRKYPSVQLHIDGVGRHIGIHILVCEAFNGAKPYPEAMCLHRDDNQLNNVPDNLYWGDHQTNMDDAVLNGRIDSEKINSAKLTWDKVRELRARAANGETGLRLANEIGMTPAAMNKLLSNQTWKDPTYTRTWKEGVSKYANVEK